MDITSLKNLINTTIKSNGNGHITGAKLNEVLNAIVDSSINGASFTSVKITLPDTYNDEGLTMLNSNSDVVEHNKNCFDIITTSEIPVIIFMQKMSENKPYSQTAIRMRTLFAEGEGTDFIVFGYPSTYNTDTIAGCLALSGELYKLLPNGELSLYSISSSDLPSTPPTIPNDLPGRYTHEGTAVSGGVILGMDYLPYITNEQGFYYINNLFGGTSDIPVGDLKRPLTIYGNTATVIGGWEHPLLGPINNDIIFDMNIVTSETNNNDFKIKLTARTPLTISDWLVFDSYTLTKK